MLSSKASKIAFGILLILHLVGFIGINSSKSELFLSLSAVHLIISALVLFWFHQKWDAKQAIALILIFVLSFGLEVAGIQSRVIFGSYDYMDMLGTKGLEVPFVIGLLWVMLVYASQHIVKAFYPRYNRFVLLLAASALMVFLDFLIEPLSESLGYWKWTEGSAPAQNYLVWFIASFVFQLILVRFVLLWLELYSSMNPIVAITVFLASFFIMEFAAWFTHKYVMHGLLWYLHKDHHQKEPGFFEKNDSFFLIFAIPSWLFIMYGMMHGNDWKLFYGLGILAYGTCYFLVHDVLIHKRFDLFQNIRHPYFKAIIRAHQTHHRVRIKEGASCFGMLWVPMEFFKREQSRRKQSAV